MTSPCSNVWSCVFTVLISKTVLIHVTVLIPEPVLIPETVLIPEQFLSVLPCIWSLGAVSDEAGNPPAGPVCREVA